jgi:hypothetical protein
LAAAFCGCGFGFAYGGWCFYSYWFISVPPVRGALTFFAAAKKVSKESGLTPPTLKRLPWLGGDRGSVEIEPAHLLA